MVITRLQNGRGGKVPAPRDLAITLASVSLLATSGAQTVLKEDWDGTSINSTPTLTNTSGTAPGVAQGGPAAGDVMRVTHLTGSNNNSVAWDYVPYAAHRVVVSVVFSMTGDEANFEAGGCCGEAADGLGFGLFNIGAYGRTGANNPAAATAANWEDPTFGSGFPNALVVGLDVFDAGGPAGNQIRVTGLDGAGEVLLNKPAPFPLNDGVFHQAVVTLQAEGGDNGLVSLELVRDVFGAAARHPVGAFVAPGIDPRAFQGRLIAGGRTGGAFTEGLVDCVEIGRFEADEVVPGLAKAFAPATVGAGSTSRLTFTISNDSPSGVRELAFADVLPAGLTVAPVPDVVTDCEGQVTAAPGGDTIRLTGGRVPANGACTISVNVAATGGGGTFTNVTGPLTSDLGYTGMARADLAVSTAIPGFSKSFQPAQVAFGGRSTLTFTIDNSGSEAAKFQGTFVDRLPPGVVVATPPNVVSSCGGTVTATPGSSMISFAPDFLNPTTVGGQETCTVSVDVTGVSVGRQENVSGEFTSSSQSFGTPVSSGFATAVLDVVSAALTFSKTFVDDPVPPGGLARLEFTITNRDRDNPATGIGFTDDLGAVIPGLVSTSGPQTGMCGAASSLSGTSVLSFSGGELAAGESCTFAVNVRVPVQTEPGAYPNATSPIRADVAGREVESPAAADTLFVQAVPAFSMSFVDDPVTADGTVTLEYQITNTSPTSGATDGTFTHELPAVLDNALSLPADGFCGAGSSVLFRAATSFDPATLSVTGMSLAPMQTCTFAIVLHVVDSAATGQVGSSTGPVSLTIDGQTIAGPPASDDLLVVAGPRLTKIFLDNPVRPGATARLRYSLSLPAESPAAATGISFTDDLGAVIPGLAATGLPAKPCGPGSAMAGDTVLSFSGGALAPGQTCDFEVELRIPGSAGLGEYTSRTSLVGATIDGVPTASSPASADFLVTNLFFEKRFLEPVALPGGQATLEFTITNAGAAAATGIVFTDDLDDMIPGAVSASGTLNDICGNGSTLSGTGTLVFQEGSVPAGSACSFRVAVDIPADTPEDTYTNVTSELFATVGGQGLSLPPATARLEVQSTLLALDKKFLTNPAKPGGVVDLQFTVTNLSPALITDIAFADPLPPGLSRVGGIFVALNVCGAGSQLSGTESLSLSGGRLAAGAACTFTVPIAVAESAQPGVLVNTTSAVTGLLGASPVRGDPAVDTLLIELPSAAGAESGLTGIQKSPGGPVTLTLIGQVGSRYCVETTTDLVEWHSSPETILGEGEEIIWLDPAPPPLPVRKFYRLTEKAPK